MFIKELLINSYKDRCVNSNFKADPGSFLAKNLWGLFYDYMSKMILFIKIHAGNQMTKMFLSLLENYVNTRN